MRVTIAPTEWQITENVQKNLSKVPNKQGFLSLASMTTIQKIKELYSREDSFNDPKQIRVIVETGYPIGTKRCVLIAECRVLQMVMNKSAVIQAKLSIVTQKEYASLVNGAVKSG